ncbi:hypothetical protein CI15_12430 [Paraburkholderia monticola]|uniref:Cell wall surface anchor family protein n=1 Tax=Paraburkholderia monticola TaxID=1399968 RepID=A0A149PT94_9BURK|nr:hypothetical protein [Paraburkholderia monticola]KXU88305.1 hypothetical protein CI15_12430 [Paraburkholderia monticola]
MADSVASPQSRPRRAASKKQRQGAVSTDTENKLARAARSAQRLAQLSGAARDDSTLDLFPDDPTRAALEAMNIDVRQGTLHGFELPDVVLQAVGALDGHASPDKAVRRVARATKLDGPVPVNEQLSGFDVEPALAMADAGASQAANGATHVATPIAEANKPNNTPTATSREASAPLSSAMAAATVARSVTALRKAAEADSATKAGAGKPSQRFAATFAKAATASRGAAVAGASASASVATSAVTEGSGAGESTDEAATGVQPPSQEPATPKRDDDNHAVFATPWRDAPRTDAAAAATRSEPELDLARATAFADTVDALYGVIADQRHAATDHSRRMKWMLSIVVGALLATVAIGIAQTLLLMRLTRETTAQQRRIEQMMQNQQAAMVSLLDAHTAMAAPAAAAATANAASAPTATAPTVPSQPGAMPAHARHAHTLHGHKARASSSN